LAFAAGQRHRAGTFLVREADPFQRLSRPPLRVGDAIAEEVGQKHVLQRAERGEQVEALEDEADLRMAEGRQLRVGHRAQIAAEDVRRAVELAVEAAEQVQERALSAPALAFHGYELAPLHRQVDAAQQLLHGKSRLARRVPLGDAAELDRAHGATSSTSRVPPRRSANDSAAIDRRTVRSGSITCPTMERATYACGPLPYALSGSVRSAEASLPKSTRTAAPLLSYSAAASGFAERAVRRSSSGCRGPPSRYATGLPSISRTPKRAPLPAA